MPAILKDENTAIGQSGSENRRVVHSDRRDALERVEPRGQILIVPFVALAAVIGALGEPRWGLDLATVETRVQNLDRLEMRMLATEDSHGPDGAFDMAEERRRLVIWLDAERDLNYELVVEIPTAIGHAVGSVGTKPPRDSHETM